LAVHLSRQRDHSISVYDRSGKEEQRLLQLRPVRKASLRWNAINAGVDFNSTDQYEEVAKLIYDS